MCCFFGRGGCEELGGELCGTKDGSGGGAGDPGVELHGLGPIGNGHVVSLALSLQKGLIFSYRYHCLLVSRTLGVIIGGRMCCDGAHRGSYGNVNVTSGPSETSLHIISPLHVLSKVKWWNFLISFILRMCMAK